MRIRILVTSAVLLSVAAVATAAAPGIDWPVASTTRIAGTGQAGGSGDGIDWPAAPAAPAGTVGESRVIDLP
ncbi:hypothetical protein [Streptomyces sp. NPDC001903]|uniref:hypothetical protein n=1 Tax=Streptomyces sp. NPDC001903 TaxID=3364622 RepID=UPI0036CA70EA